MIKRLAVSFVFFLLAILVGCSLPGALSPYSTPLIPTPENPGPQTTEVLTAQPDAIVSTETITLPSPPTLSPPPVSQITVTFQPATDTQTARPTVIPCNRAAPGRPAIDQTVQDGARMKPGEPFLKTWRLVNAGSCAWTQDYALVWFSGEPLSQVRVQNFNSVIKPGQQVDVNLDMVAPQQPGIHQSNFKLRAMDGTLFGLGPLGDAPFWVQINVEEIPVTPSPEKMTVTPTSMIKIAGSLILPYGSSLNLDVGRIENGAESDFILKKDPAGGLFSPLNGSSVILFGLQAPTEAECREATLNATPVLLQVAKNDFYICFRTNQGLHGTARLSGLTDVSLNVSYTIWTTP
jgi:hypothetical protein